MLVTSQARLQRSHRRRKETKRKKLKVKKVESWKKRERIDRQTDPVLAGRRGKEIWEWNNSANGVAHFKEAKVQNKMASSSGSMIEALRFEWSTLILYLGDGCQKWSFGFVRRWRLVLNLIFILKYNCQLHDDSPIVRRTVEVAKYLQIYCRRNSSILILSDPQK